MPDDNKALATNPMLPAIVEVREFITETHDTFTLTLRLEAGRFDFLPGQFNMLYAFGVGEVPISISGDPAAGAIVHTIRRVGRVTHALAQIKPGDQLGWRGPFGSAWPVQEAHGKDVVIIAGGIGLAPLRPVLYYLLRQREKFGRVVLLYGARSPQDILYRTELRRWQAHPDLQVRMSVDQAQEAWSDSVGAVTTLIPKVRFDPEHTIAMMCGPEIMMRFSIRELNQHGVTDAQIYLSMERNMQCAIGFCGHCQYGPHFICKDGAVLRFDTVKQLFTTREI